MYNKENIIYAVLNIINYKIDKMNRYKSFCTKLRLEI